MLRTFIQINSLFLTLLSSFFLLKGNLGLSPQDIANLSTTRFNYSPDVLTALVGQTTDIWLGFVLLLLAFLSQMGNLLWPLRWDDSKVVWKGVIASIVFCGLLFVVALLASDFISERVRREAETILDEQGLGYPEKIKGTNAAQAVASPCQV